MSDETVDRGGKGAPSAEAMAAASCAAERPGLRERKKLRTHETIAAVALELFDRQGFRATTIAQIAEAADVSPRTVSAYFPAKEDLLFPDSERAFQQLEERLVARPPGQLATDALRAWTEELFEQIDHGHEYERVRARRRVIEADEALRAYERHQMERAEQVFATALAQDLGAEPDDVAAQLAAAAAVGALAAIGRVHDIQQQTDPAAHREAALRLVDQAIVFLGGGIRELRAHRGDPPLRGPSAG